MWLRLLDLTDITKYRVTQEVFDRYFDRMSVVSRFHWIKHLCIDDLNISVKQEKKDKGNISRLFEGNIASTDELYSIK